MILKIDAVIGLEVPDAADPEEVASRFNDGFEAALDGFPGGEVVGARVERISRFDEAELNERGWSE